VHLADDKIGHFGRVRPYLGLIPVILLIFVNLGCSCSNSKPPQELRAIWVQARVTNTPEEADAMLDRVVRGRFNTILYCVGSGTVYYDSALLTPSQYVTSEYDPLAYVVKQGHARGLKVQAWWCPGVAPHASAFRNRNPGWDIADVEGIPADYHWLNFSLPEVRQFVGDVVLEIAENYDVDGVHLDYIRYPPPPPYNEVDCRDFFSPDDVPITVQGAYQRLKAVRPDVELTAAVGGSLGGSVGIMQNWADWLAGDYIDRVMPMAYLDPDMTYIRPDSNKTLEHNLREWRELTRLERIAPGLMVQLRDNSAAKTPEEFMAQIELCRTYGFSDVAVFDESTITVEILDALTSGSK
jgi:uncharacterized lipoprotein YddW (UPF0748 family)